MGPGISGKLGVNNACNAFVFGVQSKRSGKRRPRRRYPRQKNGRVGSKCGFKARHFTVEVMINEEPGDLETKDDDAHAFSAEAIPQVGFPAEVQTDVDDASAKQSTPPKLQASPLAEWTATPVAPAASAPAASVLFRFGSHHRPLFRSAAFSKAAQAVGRGTSRSASDGASCRCSSGRAPSFLFPLPTLSRPAFRCCPPGLDLELERSWRCRVAGRYLGHRGTPRGAAFRLCWFLWTVVLLFRVI